MKKIRILALVMMLTLAACSNNTSPSSSTNTMPQSETTTHSQSSENVREANAPSELIGVPDRIYIVKGENERTIEPGTDEYIEILELLRSRFPDKLKEAQRAITWADEAGFNRDMMREEFDYLELSYDVAQTVNLNCMDSDYPPEEITFEMMIFPLPEITGTVSIDTHKTSGFVGRSYGPLDKSAEIIAELLGYSQSGMGTSEVDTTNDSQYDSSALVASIQDIVQQYKDGTVDTESGAPGAAGPDFDKKPEDLIFPDIESESDFQSVEPIKGHEHTLLVKIECSENYVMQARVDTAENYKVTTVIFFG